MSLTLSQACQMGSCEQIQFLIDHQVNRIEIDQYGRSALHYCADQGNIECARLILSDKSIVDQLLNIQDHEGYSALHLACMNGNESMVKYLCELGADVQLIDHDCHSLAHWVTVCGHLHLMDILRQFSAPMHIADIHHAFPIHYASQLSSLVNKNESHITPERGLAILQKFIDYHVDIECLDKQNRTPLMWATSAGAQDALHVLCEAGANPSHADKESLTALHCAATGGHTSILRYLIEHCQCSLEPEDVNGCTALFYAVTLNHQETTHLLLEFGANSNHRDSRGRTPSHCAISKGNLQCLKDLLEHHADLWIKNKRGDYPIHEAIQSLASHRMRTEKNNHLNLETKLFDVFRYLFRWDQKCIDRRNAQGYSPLHLAASLGDIEMCRFLLECGANRYSLTQTSKNNYQTASDLARAHGHEQCAQYLLESHGIPQADILTTIFVRRIQRSFRQHRRRSMDSSREHSIKGKLLKQASICLEAKEFDDRHESQSLNLPSSDYLQDSEVQERRRIFAKSRSTLKPVDDDETKIIVHPSNSAAVSRKLTQRRQFISEELMKMKQARLHNHYIVINRTLYKILIENAFNPQSRRGEEIEKYLEQLLIAYDKELNTLRARTQSVPPKMNRRPSQWY